MIEWSTKNTTIKIMNNMEEINNDEERNLPVPPPPTPENIDQEPPFEFRLAKATSPALQERATSPAEKVAPISSDMPSESEGWLTIDVYQTPKDIIVESAVAGVSPDDLDITVTADSVSIKGARERGRETKSRDYLYQECYWGKFSRSIILPQEIDPDNASVSFKNGILTISLPKKEKEKARKLSIKSE